MIVKGKIHVIGETETFGANGFRKRSLIIMTDEQYPQFINIEFVQDKCDLLDKAKNGMQVQVSVNLRGREWINPYGEAKYFNTIQGWKIVSEAKAKKQAAKKTPPPQAEDDDLPF
ncbi:MAG: DUF3127 domain-containing protein [Bacteroidota bacterium]